MKKTYKLQAYKYLMESYHFRNIMTKTNNNNSIFGD